MSTAATKSTTAEDAAGHGEASIDRSRMMPARPWLAPVLALVGALALLSLMLLNTRFISPAEERELNPPPFNATTYAATELPKITTAVGQKAVDVTELAPALAADEKAAGEKYGVSSGTSYTIPVKASGKVAEVDENFVLLDTPGTGETKVRIPLGAALNGTPIRDVTGEITFGDFPGQTDYQQVANEFKTLMQKDIIGKLDTASLKGKTVDVTGAFATGGPPNSIIIQPLTIKAQ